MAAFPSSNTSVGLPPLPRSANVARLIKTAETATMARKKTALDFEQSLTDLQALVERLENGQLSLEDSLTAFEQGIGLTRDCQDALAAAEVKVQQLLERDGQLVEAPLDVDDAQ